MSTAKQKIPPNMHLNMSLLTGQYTFLIVSGGGGGGQAIYFL